MRYTFPHICISICIFAMWISVKGGAHCRVHRPKPNKHTPSQQANSCLKINTHTYIHVHIFGGINCYPLTASAARWRKKKRKTWMCQNIEYENNIWQFVLTRTWIASTIHHPFVLYVNRIDERSIPFYGSYVRMDEYVICGSISHYTKLKLADAHYYDAVKRTTDRWCFWNQSKDVAEYEKSHHMSQAKIPSITLK